MVIAGSVKKNVKIESYVVHCRGCDLIQEIGHIIQLFAPDAVDVSPTLLPEVETNKTENLAAGELAVENEVAVQDKQWLVTTTVYFQRGMPAVQSVRRQSAAERTEENVKSVLRRLTQFNLYRLLEDVFQINPSPWGILRGVRPTKIVQHLLDQGFSPRDIAHHLVFAYAVNREKAKLAVNVALRERPFLTARKEKTSVHVYIGIPYCPSRCAYCTFPAYPLPERAQLERFFAALTQDIETMGALIDQKKWSVATVYVGGGTPTSLPGPLFSRLMELAARRFVQPDTREFTVEAGRPDTLNEDKIASMVLAGVSRVSINPQSMHDKTLKRIGRKHSVRDIINTFAKVRAQGNVLINMDLIAGLPGETLHDFDVTLRRVAALAPDNITVHTLALKRGSRLSEEDGFQLSAARETAAMLRHAGAVAQEMGMAPYYLYRQKHMTGNLENVGYARPGSECLYNMMMIEERQTIIGIGPNAGTKVVRSADGSLEKIYNAKDVNTYITRLPVYLARRSALLARLPEGQ